MKLVIYSGSAPSTVEARPVVILADSGGVSAVSSDPGNTLQRRSDGLFAPAPQLSSEKW